MSLMRYGFLRAAYFWACQKTAAVRKVMVECRHKRGRGGGRPSIWTNLYQAVPEGNWGREQSCSNPKLEVRMEGEAS